MDPNASVTQAQADSMAQTYALIAGSPGELTPYLSGMRTANPSTKVLQYQNGTYAPANAYPMSTYDKTAAGHPVVYLQWGTWLIVPKSSWSQLESSACTQAVGAGYDGCLVDTLGQMNAGRISQLSGTPVDPATGQPWDDHKWMNLMAHEAGQVVSANTSAVVAANGLGSGVQYFDPIAPTSVLVGTSGADLGMAEQFVRAAGSSVTTYRSASAWLQDVQMLVNAESQGRGVLAITKLWVQATQAQQNAWHRYALATFLMGAGPHCYFNFSPSSGPGGVTTPTAYDRVQIGLPTGQFSAAGQMYQRSYANGLVLVNPSKQSASITLSHMYTTLQGKVVSGTFTLGPFSGDVLTNGLVSPVGVLDAGIIRR
jgi:hypothetical protein